MPGFSLKILEEKLPDSKFFVNAVDLCYEVQKRQAVVTSSAVHVLKICFVKIQEECPFV